MGKFVSPDQVNDPTDMLQDNLEYVWDELCRAYDLHRPLPDMQTLFDGAGLRSDSRSAEMILANMLLELMEEVDRFSPWYKMPARAFSGTPWSTTGPSPSVATASRSTSTIRGTSAA